MRLAKSWATLYDCVRLRLLTCTSIGAGMPEFRMASTMEPIEKKVRMSGYWLAISFRTRSMYWALLT